MAKGGEYPLSLVIRAVDRATEPLRQINERISKFTAPVRKLNNSFHALSAEAGIPKLVKGFQGAGKALGEVGSEALGLGLKVAAMAAGAGFAFYEVVKGAVDAGDKLGEMAQRVGLSVDSYAQLQFAAAQADVEQEAFNSAMDKFNKNLGDMKADGGQLLAFLNNVSPTLAVQVKAAKSTEAALGLMTEAFAKVEDPGKRAALAAAAFGKSGLQMGQFLGQGGKEIEKQRKRYLEIAGSQQAFADSAGVLDNALREMGAAFGGLRNSAVKELFPALSDVAGAITNVLAGNRESLVVWAREAGAAISGWVKGGGVDRVVAAMREWAGTISRIIDSLGGLKGVLLIVGAYLASGFVVSVVSAASALGGLIPAIARTAAALGALAIGPVVAAIGNFITAIRAGYGAMAAFNLVLIANPIGLVIAVIAALAAAAYLIYKYWEPIKKFFAGLWDGIVSAFTWAWAKIQPIVDAIMGAVKWLYQWNVGVLQFAGEKLGIIDQPAQAGGVSGSMSSPAAALASSTKSEARVQVDFTNLPKGARVSQDSQGTADLDLSMGYAMALP